MNENEFMRKFKDLPELVSILREQQARCRDVIAPAKAVKFGHSVEDGTLAHIKNAAYRIQEQAHEQFAFKLGIPSSYYQRMLREAPALLDDNANHWLASSEKSHLVRLLDDQIRAFLSDRYRPINHLDAVTVAIQVITGQDGENGQVAPHARGARCLSWDLTPKNLNIRFINPGIWVDLENLDQGVHFDADYGEAELEQRLYRRTTAENRTDWADSVVYPSALLYNSETGHGGYGVEPGLTERFCANCMWYGKSLQKRHLGQKMDDMDDIYSAETYKKQNMLIFAQTADIMRSVFDPDGFLDSCKRFKGLQYQRIDIKEAVDNVVCIPGMSEGLRDDILSKYIIYKNRGGRREDNAFDFTRALTEVAQNVEDSDKALALERYSGELIGAAV